MAGFSLQPIAQSFNIAADTVSAGFSIFPYVAASTISVIDWTLYSGTPDSPGSLVTNGSITISNTTVEQVDITFATPQTLVAGNYFLTFEAGTLGFGGGYMYAGAYLEATSTDPYASGSLWTGVDSGGVITWTQVAADDLAFIINGSSGDNELSFSSADPADILRRILDQLTSRGGLVTYSDESIDSVGAASSYDYKIQTILDAVNVVHDLSPDGWYWYIDPATNLLHFHARNNGVDHILTQGKHVFDASIEYSLEQVVNSVVFSGGDSGSGSNLYSTYDNAPSKLKYGQWLQQYSDNRVTLQETADTIGVGILDRNQEPLFMNTIKVMSSVYDIESFKLGQMVGLRNFDNLIDTIPLQIVGLRKTSTYAQLRLGNVPPKFSSAMDQVTRKLYLLDSLNNPSTPS